MNGIETPETDALLKENGQSDTTGLEDYEILAELAADLERRLTVARETLACINIIDALRPEIRDEISRVLRVTAPKP